ncbi:four-carbon acid sugar kinase family protein [Klebsiella quasipneumoniae subsp. similipneumoniae]|uniref:four-carbon acid sugar kinase family protein n=1 Tax=Klebsiella quasipneumoniae TaxID=1463165 RepID=UPI0035A25F79|nr:four-carbon acid sugar kinase family protein [Klebsiella quasipneumoniae subsp. similipneumoniae]HCF6508385.1 four-carbon acid sugar kinase family protein [Klebsiella quasipneumoniae subsp. similipneumoniae]
MIGSVTDDFTGTASAGVLIAKSQAATGLFFDADAVKNFKDRERLEAIFVSSNSRHLLPAEAYASVFSTTEELKKIGVNYFSKKIDTTLRGGIGYEIDAMLDCLANDSVAVVVTAMPQSKRICIGGFSVIDGVLLTETSIAKDVKTPVNECYVPTLLSKQSLNKISMVTIDQVIKGANSLTDVMFAERESGSKIIVVDAITLDHIDIIAQACLNTGWNILAVDPGPFTMKLNYHRGLVKDLVSVDTPEQYCTNGKVALFVVGSANPLTKVQMSNLCNGDGKNILVSVSPYSLIEGGATAQQEVDRVVEQTLTLINGPVSPEAIIIETALHNSVVVLKDEDCKREYLPGTSSQLINSGLAEITDKIISACGQEKIAGLLLTGGDTMESVCRKLEVSCIQAIDNIVAQVDIGKIIGKYDGLPVVVKGGFCGHENIGKEIVKRIFIESTLA